MIHVLTDVTAMAILAISGKGGFIDFCIFATLGLEVRFKSSGFVFFIGRT
jgi:hypothetical protein